MGPLNMTSGISSYNSHKIETKSYGNKLLLTVSLIMSFSFVIIFGLIIMLVYFSVFNLLQQRNNHSNLKKSNK